MSYPLALFALTLALLGFPPLLAAQAPTFVVYACSDASKTRQQRLEDADPRGYDPNGHTVYSFVDRWFEIVDLGSKVDDGVDEHPVRDVDDNRVFRIFYTPKPKEYDFFLDDYDGVDDGSDGSWAEFADMAGDLFVPRFQDSVLQIKVRVKSGRRWTPSLREFRSWSWNNNHVLNDLGALVENTGPVRYAELGHLEGVVAATTLRGIGTVHIPRKVSGAWYNYYNNPQLCWALDQSGEVPGKQHAYTWGIKTSAYNATLTAIVNGGYGTFTDPSTGEELTPGSRSYAVAALVEYLRRARYTRAVVVPRHIHAR